MRIEEVGIRIDVISHIYEGWSSENHTRTTWSCYCLHDDCLSGSGDGSLIHFFHRAKATLIRMEE